MVLAPTGTPPVGPARAGLYVTDTLSHDVYVAPASELKPFAGDVVVGSELRGLFWVLQPRGGGVVATRLTTTLTDKSYNLEGATYIGG